MNLKDSSQALDCLFGKRSKSVFFFIFSQLVNTLPSQPCWSNFTCSFPSSKAESGQVALVFSSLFNLLNPFPPGTSRRHSVRTNRPGLFTPRRGSSHQSMTRLPPLTTLSPPTKHTSRSTSITILDSPDTRMTSCRRVSRCKLRQYISRL